MPSLKPILLTVAYQAGTWVYPVTVTFLCRAHHTQLGTCRGVMAALTSEFHHKLGEQQGLKQAACSCFAGKHRHVAGETMSLLGYLWVTVAARELFCPAPNFLQGNSAALKGAHSWSSGKDPLDIGQVPTKPLWPGVPLCTRPSQAVKHDDAGGLPLKSVDFNRQGILQLDGGGFVERIRGVGQKQALKLVPMVWLAESRLS